jgi:hypothetical protein
LVAGFFSCKTVQDTAGASKSLVVDLAPAAIKPKVNVGGKVTGKSSIITILVFPFSDKREFATGTELTGILPNPLELQMRQAAVQEALSKNGGDYLIAPRYVTKIEDYFIFGKVEVKVTGYKATITGFSKNDDYYGKGNFSLK